MDCISACKGLSSFEHVILKSNSQNFQRSREAFRSLKSILSQTIFPYHYKSFEVGLATADHHMYSFANILN